MNRPLAFLVTLLLASGVMANQPSTLEQLQAGYAPYMDANDPLGFALKIRAVSQDPYHLWRGGKDLFFRWSKDHCREWYADRASFIPIHADLHFGNIGSYVCDRGLGKLAIGMVDFDDASILPFQIELLQGYITLDLVAQANGIALSGQERQALRDLLWKDYRIALNSRRTATEILEDQPLVKKLLERQETRNYAEELKKMTSGVHFLPLLAKAGKPVEVIREVDSSRRPFFARAIAQAIQNDKRLADLFRTRDAADIEAMIRDVGLRTRIESSGSQGLEKYMVLLDHPFKGVNHSVILYLKREIPTAAQRSAVSVNAMPGNSTSDASGHSPGERTARLMDRLIDPPALFNSWCDLQGQSFWVSFKEPWTDELDFEEARDLGDLKQLAHIWATVAGAAHRGQDQFVLLLPRLTPTLQHDLAKLADAYLQHHAALMQNLRDDPKTAILTRQANTAIQDATRE